MKQLWSDTVLMKDKKREFQPFCLAELRGGGPKKAKNGLGPGIRGNGLEEGELAGDLILGCSEGALVIYDVKAKPKHSIAIVGGIHVTDTKSGLTPESLNERRWIAFNEVEPITHIFEYLPTSMKNGAGDIDSIFDFSGGQSKPNNSNKYYGSIVASTVNGIVYMMRYQDKSFLHRFDLSTTPILEHTIPLVSHGGNIAAVAQN